MSSWEGLILPGVLFKRPSFSLGGICVPYDSTSGLRRWSWNSTLGSRFRGN